MLKLQGKVESKASTDPLLLHPAVWNVMTSIAVANKFPVRIGKQSFGASNYIIVDELLNSLLQKLTAFSWFFICS